MPLELSKYYASYDAIMTSCLAILLKNLDYALINFKQNKNKSDAINLNSKYTTLLKFKVIYQLCFVTNHCRSAHLFSRNNITKLFVKLFCSIPNIRSEKGVEQGLSIHPIQNYFQ